MPSSSCVESPARWTVYLTCGRDVNGLLAHSDGVAVVRRARASEVVGLAEHMDVKEHSLHPYIEKLKSIEEAVKKIGRL